MKKIKPIKIYLDTSVYNRPFDDQAHINIRLETEAFLSILEKAISGSIMIIGSSVLAYENNKNPFSERKERVASYFSSAAKFIRLNDSIRKRALQLEGIGIDSIDALHIAVAEFGEAKCFVTCDYDIIRKITRHEGLLEIEVCNPLEFIIKEVFKNA